MDTRILLILSCTVLATSAWSRPYYPGPRRPMRFTRFAPSPPAYLRPHTQQHPHPHPQQSQPHEQLHSQSHTPPHSRLQVQPHSQLQVKPHSHPQSQHNLQSHHKIPVESADLEEKQWQRQKRGHDDYDHDHDHKSTSGVTGPVHTFVKTDNNANYKWGVRHHVGDKYAS